MAWMYLQPPATIQPNRSLDGFAITVRGASEPTGVALSVPAELVDAIGRWLGQHLSLPDSAPIGSPWLTVVEAARRAGYECPNDRAPASIYSLAKQIGHKIGSKWLIHVDDLDQAIREGRA
jgi:hypothetical protein